jgi:hypothetical protein
MRARHQTQARAVVEAEELGWVEGAEPAEEVRVGGDPVPVLANGGGADEAGGKAQAEQDLAEDVVVAEHHGDQGCRCAGRACPCSSAPSRRRRRGWIGPVKFWERGNKWGIGEYPVGIRPNPHTHIRANRRLLTLANWQRSHHVLMVIPRRFHAACS